MSEPGTRRGSSNNRQQQQEAAITRDINNNRQQQQEATATTGRNNRRQQQQQAATITGSNNRRQQQQQAATTTGSNNNRQLAPAVGSFAAHFFAAVVQGVNDKRVSRVSSMRLPQVLYKFKHHTLLTCAVYLVVAWTHHRESGS